MHRKCGEGLRVGGVAEAEVGVERAAQGELGNLRFQI